MIREVAAGDGSTGQLLGYHLLWFRAARLVGTPGQIEAVESEATRDRWFFGGAVNPRDADVVIRDAGDHIVYNGRSPSPPGPVAVPGGLDGRRYPARASPLTGGGGGTR